MPKGLFKNTHIYKITSLQDKGVLEMIPPQVSDNAQFVITASKWQNCKAQKFRVEEVRPNEFRVSSLMAPQEALDCNSGGSLLLHNRWEDGYNQVWFAEEVVPNANVCIIRPWGDWNKCLWNQSNMGMKEPVQVRPVQANKSDRRQLWKLEATY